MAGYCNGGRSMHYANTDDCYDVHGGRRMHYSNTDDCHDVHGHGGRRMYSSRTEECYDDVDRRRPHAYAGDVVDYKREGSQHKNRERLAEVGALAGGAFALYEGQRAKKDPEHAQRHRIEEGVAAVAALGAGGYAYHEHREHKEAQYYDRRQDQEHARVTHGHGYYCN